jgi:hypothetical protein
MGNSAGGVFFATTFKFPFLRKLGVMMMSEEVRSLIFFVTSVLYCCNSIFNIEYDRNSISAVYEMPTTDIVIVSQDHTRKKKNHVDYLKTQAHSTPVSHDS